LNPKLSEKLAHHCKWYAANFLPGEALAAVARTAGAGCFSASDKLRRHPSCATSYLPRKDSASVWTLRMSDSR